MKCVKEKKERTYIAWELKNIRDTKHALQCMIVSIGRDGSRYRKQGEISGRMTGNYKIDLS